jgi:hypothetical protein
MGEKHQVPRRLVGGCNSWLWISDRKHSSAPSAAPGEAPAGCRPRRTSRSESGRSSGTPRGGRRPGHWTPRLLTSYSAQFTESSLMLGPGCGNGGWDNARRCRRTGAEGGGGRQMGGGANPGLYAKFRVVITNIRIVIINRDSN